MMWTIVLIGISTVFFALMGLSLILVLFKALFARDKPATAVQAAVASSLPAQTAGQDSQLVAVITAAIAACTGSRPSAFRITQIEKTGITTPAWGSQERTRKNPRV